MKIIILGTAYPYRGGLAVYNERLANEFIKENHQVQIVTFKLQYPGFLFPGKTQYANWKSPGNLKIIRKLNSINPFNWIATGQHIKKLKPDILIIKYWLPFMAPAFGTVAKIVRKNKHTKIISILDNIIPHEKHISDKYFSKYFVKNIDAFIGMSASVLNDLNLFTKIKPREFCPHPLYDNFGKAIARDQALKNLKLPNDVNYLLFFGLIRDYKGLDILLEAFADKRIAQLNIKLIVAGEFYSSSEKYFKQIDQYNITGSVIVHSHFIPDNEVANYFCASDLIVQPYKSATQSGVTQIAYHFNKPMIVTNVGGLAEIVPDKKCGYVVSPSPSEITEAIIDFFEKKKAQYFEPFIFEEKKKYEWSRMTSTIYDLYNKVIKNDNKK